MNVPKFLPPPEHPVARTKPRVRRQIATVRMAVEAEIRANAQGNRWAAGLANEGYAGGYVQALDDVLLALNDIPTNSRYAAAWERARLARINHPRKERT